MGFDRFSDPVVGADLLPYAYPVRPEVFILYCKYIFMYFEYLFKVSYFGVGDKPSLTDLIRTTYT